MILKEQRTLKKYLIHISCIFLYIIHLLYIIGISFIYIFLSIGILIISFAVCFFLHMYEVLGA